MQVLGLPPSSPHALYHLVATIQANAYAPGTERNLRSQLRSFNYFCEQFTLVPLPASPQTLSAYACFLSCRTSSFDYIMNHLNAVRLLHLYIGFSTESFNSFAFNLMKGLKLMMGTSSCQKHPIRPAILLSIRCSLNLSTPSHTALWALFTKAFFFLPPQVQSGRRFSLLLQLRSAPGLA